MRLPEIYMLLSVFYYWFLTSNVWNPIAIVLILILAVHLFFQKQIMGIVISSLFICMNLFLFLALISEFSEFPAGDPEGKTLLTYGLIYLGLNFMTGLAMLIKHALNLPFPQKLEVVS